ncbi:hypothetical protein K501DRAFT_333758 [Backusella circina FSU 941]|nr:hypothetical protein K501DRAFT_333758 [Backusella circina FSU 941]
MSTDDVTVSLSRLALAKAIKTPDAGEDDAEPWSRSIIFHQAHIDPQMRFSIEHPQQQQQHQQNRRRGPNKKAPHGRHSNVHLQQQQEAKIQVTPPMHRARSDEMYKHKQPTTERLSSHSASSSSAGHSSPSSTKLTNSKPTRHFVPSDDEEEEDDEESEEEEEEEEEKKVVKEKSKDYTENVKSNYEIVAPTETKKDKGKAPNRLPQPSDDEEEEEDEDNSSDSSDDDKDALSPPEDEQLYARRMSTLRRLERGSSEHRRARSLGDMNHMIVPSPPVETKTLNLPPPQEMGTIEEWRKTVMEEAEGTTSSTPVSNPSSLPDESGDQTTEEPVVPTPNTQGIKAQNRRSMLSDMDMYYYQQQQQQQMAFQNMQMQQAMQLQQAQQMAQIQQYQQMIQMQQMQQQQLMPNYNDTRKNRKSMSAMDLMIQLEEEKAASRKTNKKKPLDPSKANLDEGLLSTVPQQGLHNISFQGQSKATKKAIQRASKSDYNIQGNRPPSTLYSRSNTPMDSRTRSQMIRSESSPIPSLNMPTPMSQYLVPPQMVMQQQQLGIPQMMTPSKSTGRLSYQSNSNRLSGNWGGYNKQ